MALCAGGNVDFDKLIEDAQRLCGDWERVEANRSNTTPSYLSGFHTLHQPTAHQQYILQLAPGLPNHDPRRYALRVGISILGDDSGSRLYWDFLDSGLAESAGAGTYEYHDSGLVMTFLCCAPEQAQKNLEILATTQSKIANEGVTPQELEQTKRKIASHIVLASERTENRMFSVGSQYQCGAS